MLQVQSPTCLRYVMKYLQQNQYVQTLLTLQRQSGISYQKYSKQVQFFRRMILQGNFSQAGNFILAFQSKLHDRDFRKIMLQLRKQRLYELIQNPDEIELKELLQRDIVNYCTEEEYQALFYFLTLKNMREHPSFEKWTTVRGRLSTFQFIRPFIEIVEGNAGQTVKDTHLRLEDMVKFYFQRNPPIGQFRKKEDEREFSLSQKVPKYKYIDKLNEDMHFQPKKKQDIYQTPKESEKGVSPPTKTVQYSNEVQYHEDSAASEKNNSVVYPNDTDFSQDNFTFSQHQPVSKVTHTKTLSFKHLAFTTDPKAIRVSRFSPSGRYLGVGTLGSTLKIYQTQHIFEEQPYRPLELLPLVELNNLHQKSVFFLDWSTNQQMVVTCSNDQTIKITKFSKKDIKKYATNILGKHEAPVRMAKFNQNCTSVISCSEDATVRVWDIEKSRLNCVLKGHTYTVNALRLVDAESGNKIVSVGRDYTCRLWDIRTANCEVISQQFKSQLMFIANDGPDLVVSQKNGTLSFLDHSLKQKLNLQVHNEQIRSVQFNQDHGWYVTASFDGRICLLQQSSLSKTYTTHNSGQGSDNVVYAGFHPSGGVASCSRLGLCNIYSIR